MEEIYLAGGCLWGVQEFLRHLTGVCETEAGRANGTQTDTEGDYDGYVECVKTHFDPNQVTVEELMAYLFEIIDPYSLNQQGNDVGEKYLHWMQVVTGSAGGNGGGSRVGFAARFVRSRAWGMCPRSAAWPSVAA